MTVCVSAPSRANRPMQTRPPVFRFAPSPNGYLHLGHALSALLNFDEAHKRGGRFLLRIEDIDAARCRPEFETAIYEDLAWLGIAWEAPVRRQSQHISEYGEALRKLERDGLLYPAFESRAEIARLVQACEDASPVPWPRDPDGAPRYPGHAKSIPIAERKARIERGEPYALRLDMAAARARCGLITWHEESAGYGGAPDQMIAQPEQWGDVVIDDALQGVTHVVRGKDLFWSTSVHRLLQQLLGLPDPFYRHHRLVLDDAGQKLSKSTKATAIRELRAAGVTPADIRRKVGLAPA
jgi:glutamyl-Q tRNA(Asp) synthetase